MLERITSPGALKTFGRAEIDGLAQEIRDELVRVCAKNGGHLAPNLGVVELTMAMIHELDLDAGDKIVWDVSHQAYVHKLLTGRADRFDTIRMGGGLSGFSMMTESKYDAFGAGHASTSISAALGMATARDLAGGKETIVAVIGDGALTGGLAYEALNNAGERKSNFIVVLNDNEMSIAPNVGSLATYLARMRSKPFVNRAREVAKDVLGQIPFGETARKAFATAETAAMRFVSPSEKTAVIFEELGFRYIGPIDGHDYDSLCEIFANAKKIDGPVLLHVRTVKGRGFSTAENDARVFHGVGPGTYEADTGVVLPKAANPRPTFSAAFADALITLAERDSRIIGITAAMPDGTALAKFGKKFPTRFFDVGIAEAHAVCFAAGAAASDLKPVCAIYSTFLQRAYDQIIHDVAIQNLHVVFCMDRAGVIGDDGPTHMGLYDVAYLRTIPNVTIMAPRVEEEMLPMLEHAMAIDGAVGIRYPRGSTNGKYAIPVAPIVHGKAEVLVEGADVAILCLGNTCDNGMEAAALLAAEGITPTVVNARFVKPMDEELLVRLAQTHEHFITLEEHAIAGGFGSAVGEVVLDHNLGVTVERIGVPDVLVHHNSQAKQRALYGLTAENVASRVRAASSIARV